MKTTFHQSLIALASCDISLLGLVLLDFTAELTPTLYVLILPYFLNPFKNILLCWETFLIMSITTERFLAVYRPLLYKEHRLSYSSRVHLLTFILPPVLLAILLNIPKFYELEFTIKNVTPSLTH